MKSKKVTFADIAAYTNFSKTTISTDARREDLLLVQGELAYAQGDYEAALAPLLELTHSGDETLVSRSYLPGRRRAPPVPAAGPPDVRPGGSGASDRSPAPG